MTTLTATCPAVCAWMTCCYTLPCRENALTLCVARTTVVSSCAYNGMPIAVLNLPKNHMLSCRSNPSFSVERLCKYVSAWSCKTCHHNYCHVTPRRPATRTLCPGYSVERFCLLLELHRAISQKFVLGSYFANQRHRPANRHIGGVTNFS